MRRLAVLIPLLALAACATPQELCIAAATRDLRVLDRLIAGTEANLARGFAIDEAVRVERRFVPCGNRQRIVTLSDGTQRVVDDGPAFCWRDVPVTVARPRAIDTAVERRILASTRAERARRARAVDAAVAECRRRHPA